MAAAGTEQLPTDSGLGRAVMMVPVMMMPHSSESRGGEDHQQQGSNKNLLHAKNVARSGDARKWAESTRTKAGNESLLEIAGERKLGL
jgi:hypothetical protein